jgi:hypothetical protein
MPKGFPLTKLVFVLAATCLAFSDTTRAQTATDELGQCLVMNSTGANRIALIRWVAFAISVHPAIRDVIAVTPSEIEKSDKEVAALFTELLVVKCPTEAKAVLSNGGDSSTAMRVAFEQLGKIAGQEVFSAPELQTRMTGFTKYINENDFQSLGIK